MENGKRNLITIQIILGIMTFVMGIVSMIYALLLYLGKIQGDIGPCIILLMSCVLLSMVSIILVVVNGIKYKKK